MVQRVIFSLSLILLSLTLNAATKLSKDARISVYTLGPSQAELYSAFGHSAFRVLDDSLKRDIIFNYGIFDFDQPNFYLNFTKGKLFYMLGVGRTSWFLQGAKRAKRYANEQILNLSQKDKQALYDFLVTNSKPQNRGYYYNYCYNNCATKIRDVLDEVIGGRLTYDYSYVEEPLSYRDLMDLYLDEQPWGDLGIDLCLGAEIDQIADGAAYMYMPEYVELALDKATIAGDSSALPLVREKLSIIPKQNLPNAASPIKPIHVFVGLFFIVGLLTHRGLKYGLSYKWLDMILFGVTGFFGCFLLFLWFGTDHLSQNNYNVIWAMPLNLLAVVFLVKKQKPAFLKFYLLIYGVLILLQIVFQFALIQKLHLAFVPLVLALAIRSFFLYFDLKRKEKRRKVFCGVTH